MLVTYDFSEDCLLGIAMARAMVEELCSPTGTSVTELNICDIIGND